MIIELDKLDHAILIKESKNILMLIFDPADIWKVEEKEGLKRLFKQNSENDMMRKHYIYLCKKIENYINYITNNGLINNFPEIKDSINEYSYEIRVVTQFNPEKWYLDTINEFNKKLEGNNKKIVITHELKFNKRRKIAMKNIQIYKSNKYNTSEYEQVDENIYKTTIDYVVGYKSMIGKTMYHFGEVNPKGPKTWFKKKITEKHTIFVTSISFIQEPEYGENNPSDKFISQYPLEDVLDKFECSINDTYYEQNENDSEKSYVEIASDNIGNLRKLLSIIGKHVYIKEDGKYANLIIE